LPILLPRRDIGLEEGPLAVYLFPVILPEEIVAGEWADWYRLTPLERWHESQKLRAQFLAMGGSLDPEPDTESPFYNERQDRLYWQPLKAELEKLRHRGRYCA
jgi:hypothetical protein